jgi:hypothetical protein
MTDFNRDRYLDYAGAGAGVNQNRNLDYLLYSA